MSGGGTHPKPTLKNKTYEKEQVEDALIKIENGVSLRRASKEHGIPKTTLKRIIQSGNKIPKNGKATVLSEKEERMIAEWVKECGERGFGKTKEMVCEAVKQV